MKASRSPAAPNAKAWVVLEQNNKAVGTGVLLGGDGRILAAYRPAQSADPPKLTVRYSDGAKVPARVVHTDSKLGLALLVPERGKRTADGIRASEKSPENEALRPWISAAKAGVVLKAVPFVFAQGTPEEITGVWQPTPSTMLPSGTPLIDGAGDVIGFTTRLCTPGAAGCATEAVVPVALVRRFLGRAPATAAMPTVWLGIAGDPTVLADGRGGVRVLAVAPKSPAEKAKVVGDSDPTKSDVVVAVDGKPVATVEELAARVGERGVGDKLKFDLVRGGKSRSAQLVLETPP